MNKDYLNYPVVYIFGIFTIFVALFPWVSFGLNSNDTQPWALFCSVIFLLLVGKVPQNYITIFILAPFVASVLIIAIPGKIDGAVYFRGLFGYFSLSVILLSLYIFYRRYGLPVKILVFANLIYLAFGFLQLLFGKYIFEFLSPIRTTVGRGYSSLAIEPTYFGLVLLCFNLIYYKKCYRDKNWNNLKLLFATNVFFIIFVAQSSLAILLLVLWLIFSFTKHIKYLFFLMAIFIVTFNLIVDSEEYNESRIIRIQNYILDGGIINLIKSDASTNYRLGGIVLPFLGVADNLLAPGGYGTYSKNIENIREQYQNIFWYGEHSRIYSYLGTVVYELGIFGIIYLLFFFAFILWKESASTWYFPLLIFLLFLNSLPISSPFVCVFIAYYIATIVNKKHSQTNSSLVNKKHSQTNFSLNLSNS